MDDRETSCVQLRHLPERGGALQNVTLIHSVNYRPIVPRS